MRSLKQYLIKKKRFFTKKKELKNFSVSSTEEVFTYIYNSNKWGDQHSRSGKGSNLARTEQTRRELPRLLTELGVHTLLDIPCGDFFWMKEIDLPVTRYIGGDIVKELVADNNRLYGTGSRRFEHLDLLRDPLPAADLVLCRECLVHLAFADIHKAISNIKASGNPYLMVTHFPQIRANRDIVTGKHRALNMTLPPFNWPLPCKDMLEYPTGRKAGNKHLSTWRTADIPNPA
ncbi:MAG: class I SAM-dependent methyltransferase [Pseudohongiellaceae bacterium]